VSRLWHVFRAPGEAEQPLPIPASPWHQGRAARLPEDQWECLLAFARSLDQRRAEILEQAALLEDDEAQRFAASDVREAQQLLEQMMERIPGAPPLRPDGDDAGGGFSAAEQVRMLEAVHAVLAEALRTGQPFEAWVD
jgi:hypothetical protein